MHDTRMYAYYILHVYIIKTLSWIMIIILHTHTNTHACIYASDTELFVQSFFYFFFFFFVFQPKIYYITIPTVCCVYMPYAYFNALIGACIYAEYYNKYCRYLHINMRYVDEAIGKISPLRFWSDYYNIILGEIRYFPCKWPFCVQII